MSEPAQVEQSDDPLVTSAATRTELIDLYKMYVSNAEAVVSRRQSVNTFFLSVNTLLLSAIALVTEFGAKGSSGPIAIAILGLTGVVLSGIWKSIIGLYGRQRTSMFFVIYALEEQIGVHLFRKEWLHLNGTRSPSSWRTFTNREARVPVVFVAVYLVALIGAVLVALRFIPT